MRELDVLGGGKGILISDEKTNCIATMMQPKVAYSIGHDLRSEALKKNVADPLTATDYKQPTIVAFDITGQNSNSIKSDNPTSCFKSRDIARCLDSFSGHPDCNQGGTVVVNKTASNKDVVGTLMANCGQKQWLGNQEAFTGDYHIVDDEKPHTRIRRLTPLECGRLQGFPDYWCEGVEGTDSAQYKMWGNGMALPCMLYVVQGIKDELKK